MQQIQGAIGDLSKKLDSKPTNWLGVISALTAILVVIGGSIGFLIAPINSDLARHERDINRVFDTSVSRSEYTQHHEELARWLENVRDRQRSDEDGAVTRREFDALSKRLDDETATRSRGDIELVARFAKDIDRLTTGSVARSDLDAEARRTDERINTIGNGLHDLQHDFYTSHGAPVSPAK